MPRSFLLSDNIGELARIRFRISRLPFSCMEWLQNYFINHTKAK